MKKTLEITIETATRWYNSENVELKDLALQTFPELGVKQLPKTWEELGELEGYYVDDNSEIIFHNGKILPLAKNTFATKEQAEASIALAQLSQLRDVYRGEWVPNWNTTEAKFCIELYKYQINKMIYTTTHKFLSFQDAETRDLFLENFRELIEKAKPLCT